VCVCSYKHKHFHTNTHKHTHKHTDTQTHHTIANFLDFHWNREIYQLVERWALCSELFLSDGYWIWLMFFFQHRFFLLFWVPHQKQKVQKSWIFFDMNFFEWKYFFLRLLWLGIFVERWRSWVRFQVNIFFPWFFSLLIFSHFCSWCVVIFLAFFLISWFFLDFVLEIFLISLIFVLF